MTEKIIHQLRMTRFPDFGEYRGHRVDISARLFSLNGQTPYFSVTGAVFTERGQHVAGGCSKHDLIGKLAPELLPVIKVHLCHEDGEPMHAETNGWYWLAAALGGMGEKYHGGTGKVSIYKSDGSFAYREPTPEECLQIFADHCLIDLGRAVLICDQVGASTEPRKEWGRQMELLRLHWRACADMAIAVLKGTVPATDLSHNEAV